MPPSSQPVLLPPTYRAGAQAWKLVALTVFAVACGLGATWWGLDLGQTYGLAEADGGLLKPLWQRAALGVGLALLGLSFPAGMLGYLSHYIIRLDPEEEGRVVRIGRLAPFPALRLPADQVKIEDDVHGRRTGVSGPIHSRMSSVDAPWVWVEIRGWRWPLVLDLRGKFLDREGAAGSDLQARRGGEKA